MSPEDAARYKDCNVQKIREVSIHNSESDTMTLGKFEPSINSDGTENWLIAGERSYNTIAQNNGDMYFDMKDGLYEEIQTRYNISSNEMFEKFNIPAINKAIEENKIIRFSHNPNLNKYKNSYMYLEWSYLKNECQYTHLIQKGEYWYAVK